MYDGEESGNWTAQRQFAGALYFGCNFSHYCLFVMYVLGLNSDGEFEEEEFGILSQELIVGLLENLLAPGDSYAELSYSEFPHLALYGPPVKGFYSYATFP